MNCRDADSKMIASDINSLQENKDAKLKHSCNDEENLLTLLIY